MSKHLPVVKLHYWLPNSENIIASAAKATLSPREFSEISENMDKENTEKWISELITRGHGSPLEHSIYLFEVICSRICSHQLVRHRHASYSQLSQRYSDRFLRGLIKKICMLLGLNYVESFNYYVDVLEKTLNTQLSYEELYDVVGEAFIIPPVVVLEKNTGFLRELLKSTLSYYKALRENIPYEDARYLLPQAVKTRLIISMNARELLEVFLPLRMCTRAQWEIRLIAWNMWKLLVEIHPSIFTYTGPRCILYDNRSRVNPCRLEQYLSKTCEFTIDRCPEKIPRESIRDCIEKALNPIP